MSLSVALKLKLIFKVIYICITCEKEKSLSKLTSISLDKHLKLIYNITRTKRKQDIITSINTKF